MGNPDLSSEEMQRYIEAQKKKLEEALARMTPEERAEAENNFAVLRQADEARLRKTLDDARSIMEMNTAQEHHQSAAPGSYVPEAMLKGMENPICFFPNCGAKADGGKFCEFCGSPLKTQ